MDDAFLEQYQDCDGYVVLTDTSHIGAVIAYYDEEKPIYRGNGASAANPFKNYAPIADFDAKDNAVVLLFLNVGELPSEEYTEYYDVEALGTINECGNLTDAFLLKRK